MGVLTPELTDFLDAHRVGVLATIGGRQATAVRRLLRARRRAPADLDRVQAAQGARRRRSGWASLCVLGHEQPYPSAVFSGAAEILTEDIGPPTAAIMQRIAGMPSRPSPERRSTRGDRSRHPRHHDRHRDRGELPAGRRGLVNHSDRVTTTRPTVPHPRSNLFSRGRNPDESHDVRRGLHKRQRRPDRPRSL